MAYCIKCGVELSESEEKCPLCNTVVFHPDLPPQSGKRPYPPYRAEREETMKSSGVLFILTFIFFSAMAMTLIINLSVNGAVTWGGYPTGALLVIYFSVIFPMWFKRPNPVICAGADFAAVALYLMYINYITEGNWFVTFALPVTGGLAFITVGAIALLWYLKRGHLYVFSGIFMALGLFAVLLERLINYTFSFRTNLIWSIYPLSGSALVSVGLLCVAIFKPLRESLYKRFFV